MNCTNEREALRAALSSAPATLSSEQIDRLLEHADECSHCSAEFREVAAQAILAQSPAVRLDRERATRMRARIVAQAVGSPELVRRIPPPRTAQLRTSGWLAAAALAVALVTHHGFHEPLRSGWLAAAGFAALAFALGGYALAQKRRAETLEDEVISREHPPSGAR